MRFVSKHGLSMQWRRNLANSTLKSLPLQLCSQPLTGNSFAIDRLGNLFPFLVLWIAYPFLSFF
jgi:hypothetical protein